MILLVEYGGGADGATSSRPNGPGMARNRAAALRPLNASRDGNGLSSSVMIPVADWANYILTDERKSLERCREVAVLQPT